MNTRIQSMLESLVSVEAPTVDCPWAATKSQATSFGDKTKQGLSVSYGEEGSEGLLSDDLQIGEASDEELPAIPCRDDRKSCRYAVAPSQRPCRMKVGTDVMWASLADMSEGGFAVLVDHLDGLRVGQTVELETDMGCFTVRITYINEVAYPKGVASGRDFWFRVGVKKLRPSFLSRLFGR